MKEPYGKGLATHPDPESCAGHGNMTGEALTRAHAGQPLSSEITTSACRPRPEQTWILLDAVNAKLKDTGMNWKV